MQSDDNATAQIKAAVAADDAKALGHAAHALKSSAADGGAEILAAGYRELETFA